MDFRAPTTRTQPTMWGKLTQQTVQRASRTTSHASARDAPAHTITNSLQMERKISPQNVRSTNYKSVGKNLLLDYVRVFEDGHQRIAKGLRGDDGGPSVIAK